MEPVIRLIFPSNWLVCKGVVEIKAIFLDLDGTLNNDQKQITPRTSNALICAQKQGVKIVLASARPSPGLYKERDILKLQNYGGILMSYNGGRIVDAATNKVLFETSMDQSQAAVILRYLEHLPVTPILDNGKQFYVTDRDGFMVDYECKNNNMVCSVVDNLAEFLNFRPVKILMSVDPEIILSVKHEISVNLPDNLSVVQTAPFYLEIIPAAIHKGRGLLETCRVIDVDANDSVAFGDAENDIPMLKAAGVGVAMGNASDAVKMAADIITLSNNEDGIAVWLEDNYFKYV